MFHDRSRQHPLKWIVLWACLWQSDPVEQAVSKFVQALNGQNAIEPGDQHLLWPAEWGQRIRVALPMEVEQAFHAHQTIADVASAIGVSIDSARSWLTEHPEFARAWINGVRTRRLQAAKAGLLDAMEAEPTISRTELVRRHRRESEWLNYHAPQTLRTLLDRLPSPRTRQNYLF
jgi:hypothetical protein